METHALQGGVSKLRWGDCVHPHVEHLKRIEYCIKSSAKLTKQFLGFARGGKYEVKPTDMNEIIDKGADRFGRTKKEVTIRLKSQRDIWSVEVDQQQIEQVLLNLYVNAWQAMSEGGDLLIQTENVVIDENNKRPYQVKLAQTLLVIIIRSLLQGFRVSEHPIPHY